VTGLRVAKATIDVIVNLFGDFVVRKAQRCRPLRAVSILEQHSDGRVRSVPQFPVRGRSVPTETDELSAQAELRACTSEGALEDTRARQEDLSMRTLKCCRRIHRQRVPCVPTERKLVRFQSKRRPSDARRGP